MSDLNDGFEHLELTWAEVEAYEKRARTLRAEAVAYGLRTTKSFFIKTITTLWHNWIIAPRDVAAEVSRQRPNLGLHAPERPEIFGATNA